MGPTNGQAVCDPSAAHKAELPVTVWVLHELQPPTKDHLADAIQQINEPEKVWALATFFWVL